MNWLRAHWNAGRLALERLAAAPLNSLLSILGIGIALALPAGGHLFLGHIATLTQNTSHTPQLTLFLTLEADRKSAQAIEQRLRERGDVAKIQLLAREETLARMKQSEGLADVIAALPKNPFPDALVVTPADEKPATLEDLAAAVKKWPQVEHVQTDTEWARRLAAFIRLAHTGLLLLAILFGIGLVTITFSTIRLQVLTRQAEVEVSRLLGATDAFIRRPFLWHGSLLGFLGGTVAWLIVACIMLWLRAPIAELAGLYGFDLQLAIPDAQNSTALFTIAASLGWLGAALSMRQGFSGS